jgi:hypothetical protein
MNQATSPDDHKYINTSRGGKPSKVLAVALALIVLFSLALFGLVEILNTRPVGLDAASKALRDAATALLVGATIALIFELVVQRRASKASEAAVARSLAPIRSFLSILQAQLKDLHEKARETVALSHVMTVAEQTGMVDIFENRRQLFDRELKARLTQNDIKRILLVGVSLRDFFAGDAPLYGTMTALNERMRLLKLERKEATEISAIIMKGNCANADLRITIEEGKEFRNVEQQTRGRNWREKSRLWSDYKRVTDAWELHFDQVDLYEFDHLPTAWVVLIESRDPGKSVVYVEQYHYGRLTRGGGSDAFYSCLGGKCPVLKYGEGEVFGIFRNHLQALRDASTKRTRVEPR